MLADSLNAEYLVFAAQRADVSAVVEGKPAEAVRDLEQALARVPLESIDAYGRPYHALATAYIRAGQPARAEALLARFEAEVPAGERGDGEAQSKAVRGRLALQRGNPQLAIQLLRESTAMAACKRCILPDVAIAFDALGQPDSAAVQRELIATTSDGFGAPSRVLFLPDAYMQLGAYYETRNPRKAIDYYTRLINLWKSADPQLQGRVREAERRRAALVRAIG